MNWKDPSPERVLRGILWRFSLIILLAALTLFCSVAAMISNPHDPAMASAFFLSFIPGVACIMLCSRTLKRIEVYRYLTMPVTEPEPPAPQPPPPLPDSNPDQGTPIGTAI